MLAEESLVRGGRWRPRCDHKSMAEVLEAKGAMLGGKMESFAHNDSLMLDIKTLLVKVGDKGERADYGTQSFCARSRACFLRGRSAKLCICMLAQKS